jgi:hypothetical protein
LASLFFKPSRNSVTCQEESQASAIYKAVQLVPPVEEEEVVAAIGAVATIGAAVLGAIISLLADFGGPLAEDFLQIAMLSE